MNLSSFDACRGNLISRVSLHQTDRQLKKQTFRFDFIINSSNWSACLSTCSFLVMHVYVSFERKTFESIKHTNVILLYEKVCFFKSLFLSPSLDLFRISHVFSNEMLGWKAQSLVFTVAYFRFPLFPLLMFIDTILFCHQKNLNEKKKKREERNFGWEKRRILIKEAR